MRINREKLLGVLDQMTPGLSSREAIEQSGCFIFKDGQIMSFNDETACVWKSPLADLKGAVQANPFRTLLQRMKEESIEVTQNKHELYIRGKGKKSGIMMERKIFLPIENLEQPKKWTKLPSRFADAVQFVQECAGKDVQKFSLTCIHIHPQWIEASDNSQLARVSLKTGLQKSMLVPQISLRHIVPMAMTEFCQGKNWMHFRNPNKLILSCRIAHGYEYLDLTKEVEQTGEKVVLPKGLAEAAGRAEIFSQGNDRNEIQIDLEPGRVVISSTGHFGWHKEFPKIGYKGTPLSFMISPTMLVRLLQQQTHHCEVTKSTLKVTGEKSVFITSLSVVKSEKETRNGKARKQ